MILVTGRSPRGKREFVRQCSGGQDIEPVVWTEGVGASWEGFMDNRFCRDFQLFVRRVMEGSVVPCDHEPEGPVMEQLLRKLLTGPEDRALVTDETGYGIVPADASRRLCREEAERLCYRVTGEAEEVWRVCHGIGMWIRWRGR